MHQEVPSVDIEAVVDAEPVRFGAAVRTTAWAAVLIGVIVFFAALFGGYPVEQLWGAYYVNLLFWMGLSVGALMTTAIFQIVRAVWCVPIRRIAEANVAFLPWAYLLFLATYFGKEYLFPWGRGPMPGREWWMQPDFAYARFAVLFLGFFYLLYRYTRLSVRSDFGYLREKPEQRGKWTGFLASNFTKNWSGSEEEVPKLQRKMTYGAPVVVLAYVMVWTLFATEMVGGMDTIWYSNMLGGFQFLGNIYMGWAAIAVTCILISRRHEQFDRHFRRRQMWDLGMLTFGFCMLWGYTFFSQFLPQWYGSLPEETQWLILRTRELPWMFWSYLTLSLAFFFPFIVLLSDEVKKNSITLSIACCVVFAGVWLEKFVLVMPQISPESVPFGIVPIGIFIGMLGIYVLSIQGFLAKVPFMTVSHPQVRGDVKSW